MAIQREIASAIVAVMQTVEAVGQVHNRNKYNASWDKFFDQFAYNWNGQKQVRGWYLSIPTVTATSGEGDSFDSHWDTYDYVIRGLMSYSDGGETEPAFEDLIYTVRDVLQAQGTFGLVSAPDRVVDGSIAVTIPTVDMRTFGSVLMHYCEMHLQVTVNSDVVWVSP